MSESPVKKAKVDRSNWEWAVIYLYEDCGGSVTFFPYDTFKIDLEKNVWEQAQEQVNAFYEADEDVYDRMTRFELIDDAAKIAERFMDHTCIPMTYFSD